MPSFDPSSVLSAAVETAIAPEPAVVFFGVLAGTSVLIGFIFGWHRLLALILGTVVVVPFMPLLQPLVEKSGTLGGLVGREEGNPEILLGLLLVPFVWVLDRTIPFRNVTPRFPKFFTVVLLSLALTGAFAFAFASTIGWASILPTLAPIDKLLSHSVSALGILMGTLLTFLVAFRAKGV